jgi:hypothetical protein
MVLGVSLSVAQQAPTDRETWILLAGSNDIALRWSSRWPRTEQKALIGNWQVVQAWRDGCQLTPSDWTVRKLELTSGRAVIVKLDGVEEGTWELPSEANTIDFWLNRHQWTEGNVTTTVHYVERTAGIYAVDKHHLLLCIVERCVMFPKDRPKEIATTRENNNQLYLLTRE